MAVRLTQIDGKLPSLEAGAPVEKEIEVTPEMIAAGVDVLWDSGAVENPMDGVDQELVRKIFVAMCYTGVGIVKITDAMVDVAEGAYWAVANDGGIADDKEAYTAAMRAALEAYERVRDVSRYMHPKDDPNECYDHQARKHLQEYGDYVEARTLAMEGLASRQSTPKEIREDLEAYWAFIRTQYVEPGHDISYVADTKPYPTLD